MEMQPGDFLQKLSRHVVCFVWRPEGRRRYAEGSGTVATLEERVAYLEGKVEEHSRGLDGVREAIVHLKQRMDRRFEGMDRRFEGFERRFEGLERRVDALDQKMSRQFLWLVGLQVTTLAGVLAAFAAVTTALVGQ